MIVEIKSDVFENDKFYIDLRHLIELCTYEHRYDFHIDIHLIQHTNSFTKLDKDKQDEIIGFHHRSTTQSWKFTHSISEKGTKRSYTIKEAIRFLNQPFYIFLENSLNDGYFLDCLLKNFKNKNKSKKIKHHKEKGWLVYEMGGGSAIYKAIESKLKPFENFSKPKYKYLRCFVLVDSDKSYPTKPYKTELQKLIEFLKENEIPYHILEKREMENYLPEVVFDEIEGNNEFIDAYKRLNPLQKDFFDLERGFPNKNFEDLHIEIKSLLNDISPEDKIIFRKKKLEFNGNFKKEFPKLFESDSITRENLLERCKHQRNPNELPDLLTRIKELL